MDCMPEGFTGPEMAFRRGVSNILEWSKDKNGHRAALLVLMYAEQGSISYYAPYCPHTKCHPDTEPHRMVWDADTLKWKCKIHRKQRCVLKGSPFFSFLRSVKDLGKFVSFCTYYFDTSTSITSASRYVGIGVDTGIKWALRIRETFHSIKQFLWQGMETSARNHPKKLEKHCCIQGD
eukprot:615464_1